MLAPKARQQAARSFGLLLALLFVVALGVRLIRIGDRAFWTDEGYSAWLSAQPVAVIVGHDPFHPPLYPLLLKGWAALHPLLDGDGGRRLLSALAGALTVVVCTATVRALGLPGAGLTAALTTTSALGVWYSQEQRSVALTALLLTVAAAALALLLSPRLLQPTRGHRRGGDGRHATPLPPLLLWAASGLAALLGVWTHYAMIPLLGALSVAFLAAGWKRRDLLVGWSVVTALVMLGSLPLLPRLEDALGQLSGHRFAERAVLLFVPGVAALVLAGAGGWWVVRRHPATARPLLGRGAAVVILGLAAIMLTPAGNSIKRHLAVVAPLALTSAAVSIAAWRPRLGPPLVAAGLPALALVLFLHPKEDWHGVAALLKAEEQPGDVLVLYQGYQAIVLARYYNGALPLITFGEGEDPAQLAPKVAPASRVWLVEVNPTVPPSLVPTLEALRRKTVEQQFPRIRVARFE